MEQDSEPFADQGPNSHLKLACHKVINGDKLLKLQGNLLTILLTYYYKHIHISHNSFSLLSKNGEEAYKITSLSVFVCPLIMTFDLVDVDEIMYGGDTIVGNIDAITFNTIGSTILFSLGFKYSPQHPQAAFLL